MRVSQRVKECGTLAANLSVAFLIGKKKKPTSSVGAYLLISALRMWRREDQEFKVILGCTVSRRPAWTR